MNEEKEKNSPLQAMFKAIKSKADEARAKSERESALIQHVESLAIYKGARRDSSWFAFRYPVNKKTAPLVLDVIKDTMELHNIECNPEQYREEWEQIFWYTRKLAAIEDKIKFKGEKPSQVLHRLKRDYDVCVFQFLDRYTDCFIHSEIAPLKTKRGKLNRAEKFIPGLDDMWAEMSEDARERAYELDSLIKAQIELGEI